MRRISICISLLLTLTAVNKAEAVAKYSPFGVQNDVAVATVLGGGWDVLYQGPFGEVVPSVSGLFKRACGQIMLASKHLNSNSFDVLATIDAQLFQSLNTPRNETVLANGAQWYKNEFSLGFAGADDRISQTSADTVSLMERDRLSWHTLFFKPEKTLQMNGGWRSGNNYELNRSEDWERFILTLKSTATGSPSAAKPDCMPIG